MEKELSSMSKEELKELLNKAKEREKRYDELYSKDKILKKLKKEQNEIYKIFDRVDKREDAISRLVTINGELPDEDSTYTGDISPLVFKAIRKAGFKISNLSNRQLVDLCRYIYFELCDQDKELKEFKKIQEKLSKRDAELSMEISDREVEIWKKVDEELGKIDFTSYEIENELKRREMIKKHPKLKEKFDERKKFDESYDKIFQEFLKLKEKLKGKLADEEEVEEEDGEIK